MTVINLLTWEGYAIYRALQGEAIPSFRVWDNARVFGHSGGNYQKSRYFETNVFDGTFCNNYPGYCKLNPRSGTSFVIEKSNGTLGASGVFSYLYSDKSPEKAYLNVDIYEYLQSIKFKSALPVEEHFTRTKAAVREVAVLLRTSGIDTDFYNKMTAGENPSPAWLSLTSAFEISAGELVADIDTSQIPTTLSTLAEKIFGLSNTHRDLISGASSHSFFLGNRNWFALMFSHCFKSEMYAAVSRSGLSTQAGSQTEENGSETEALGVTYEVEANTSISSIPIKTNQGNAALEKELVKDYRRVPIFLPSKAEVPEGYKTSGDEKNDLHFALKNPDKGMRSFFNDLPLLNNEVWIESTLFIPAFNESLYSQLVMEFHRFSMTQLRTQKNEVLKDAERKGAGVGALLGFITGGGLMAPFMAMMGANLNKMAAINVDPSKPIEEYIPDPRLLFLRDEGSYSALREAYQSSSIKRRVCLRKIEKDDGNIYWDAFPMILLDRQAIPAQVFKWENNYFLRPITAGLVEADIGMLGYNPFKMRRSLSYHPGFDIIPPAEFSTTSIVGPTIERHPVIFKTGLREDRSFPHYYFDYPKETQVF